MSTVQWLNFQPLPGLASRHLQTIIPIFRRPEKPPESVGWKVDIGEGDFLSCEVSKPRYFAPSNRTVVLLHGLGGSHNGQYMVRMARKVAEKGMKAVRVNLRGCGSGQGLSKLPYHAGCSEDVYHVLKACKREDPDSKVTVIGFSLGGNIALKLAGELGESASEWMEACFAVCSPLDLGQTGRLIAKKRHYFYHRHYLKRIVLQAQDWMQQKVSSIYEFDQVMTAPVCGFKDADDYHQKCSSKHFIPKICCPTHLLFAADDPFIDLAPLKEMVLPIAVKVWLTSHGGHMGFLSHSAKSHNYYWMDQLLLNWLDGDFASDVRRARKGALA